MYTTIVIFYLSLIAMILMVVLKARRSTNQPSDESGAPGKEPRAISKILAKTDHFFSKIFLSVRQTISYINKHTFISLAQWIAYHILRHVRVWYIEVRRMAHDYPHTKKVIDMVRGRGEVKKHGSSVYLKRISKESEK